MTSRPDGGPAGRWPGELGPGTALSRVTVAFAAGSATVALVLAVVLVTRRPGSA